MVYPALLPLLPLMRTPRLPVVEWTDAPADLKGLVRFAERRNLVSARVPSHFKSQSSFVGIRNWHTISILAFTSHAAIMSKSILNWFMKLAVFIWTFFGLNYHESRTFCCSPCSWQGYCPCVPHHELVSFIDAVSILISVTFVRAFPVSLLQWILSVAGNVIQCVCVNCEQRWWDISFILALFSDDFVSF